MTDSTFPQGGPQAPGVMPRRLPQPRALLELIKPVTWFPPMWAYLCGVVAAGVWPESWALVALGVLLAGPVVCGMSQAANDWCDRHVDAINEPHRPIPSGRIPGRWGLWVALAMTALALALAWPLGAWGFWATVLAVLAAWAYSAPPLRLKRSGWWGPGLVGLSYETLPWIAAVAVTLGAGPRFEVLAIALVYGLGAHGIMTVNDFKAIEGDRRMGIRSLPAVYGPADAARMAVTVMGLAPLLVATLLLIWGAPWHAGAVLALWAVQLWASGRWMADPRARAPWFNGTGVGPYVLGMMVAAHALGGLA